MLPLGLLGAAPGRARACAAEAGAGRGKAGTSIDRPSRKTRVPNSLPSSQMRYSPSSSMTAVSSYQLRPLIGVSGEMSSVDRSAIARKEECALRSAAVSGLRK